MSFRLFSGYSSNALGNVKAYVNSGSFFRTFQTTAGNFFTGFSASIDNINYSDFLVSMQTSLRAAYPETNASIRYDWNSDRIILSSSVAATWQFEQDAQRILGFNQAYTTPIAVITGAYSPWYIWNSTNPERSNDSEIYEAEQIFAERMADSGRTYSVGQSRTCFNRDWDFNLEPKENVFSDKALSSNTFTYDVFLKELRKGPTQFVIFDDTIVTSSAGLTYENRDGTYEMRPDSYAFQPVMVMQDYWDYWNVKLKTRLLSRPNQNIEQNFSSNPTWNTGSLYQDDLYYLALPQIGATITQSNPANGYNQIGTYVEQSLDKRLIDINTNFQPGIFPFRFRADTFATNNSWTDINLTQSLTQTTASSQPTLVAAKSDFGNRASFDFKPNTAGTSSYLISPTVVSRSEAPFGTNPISVMFPITFYDDTSFHGIFSTNDFLTENNGFRIYTLNSPLRIVMLWWETPAKLIRYDSGPLTTNTPYVVFCTFDPQNRTGGKIYIDNVENQTIISNTTTVNGTIGSGSWVVGGSRTTPTSFATSASIPEILVTNTEISSSSKSLARRDAFNYFNKYYSLNKTSSYYDGTKVGLRLNTNSNIQLSLPNEQFILDYSITSSLTTKPSASLMSKADIDTTHKDGYTVVWCGRNVNTRESTGFIYGRFYGSQISASNPGLNSTPFTTITATGISAPSSASISTIIASGSNVINTLKQTTIDASQLSTIISVWDYTNKSVRLYQNGNLLNDQPMNLRSNPLGNTIEAGIDGLNTATTTQPINAQSTFAAVYRRPLNANQINSILQFASESYAIPYTPVVDINYNLPPITSSLEFWGDLSSVDTSIVSGSVAQLGDRSGYGRHFSQATVANRPIYNATDASFGNQPTMTFDGITSSLLSNATIDLGNEYCTIYTIVQPNNPTQNFQTYIFTGFHSLQATPNISFGTFDTIFDYSIARSNNFGTKKATTVTNTIYRPTVTYDISLSGALAVNPYMNGLPVSTSISSDLGNPTTFINANYRIGSYGTGNSNFFKGKIATMLIYSTKHTDTQVAQMDTWLKNKYNLP